MRLKLLFFIASMVVAYLTGFLTHKFEWFPFYQVKKMLKPLESDHFYVGLGNNLTTSKQPIDCSSLAQKTLVILSIGQSNIANSGNSVSLEKIPSVYNYNLHDENCYQAVEPLLGSTGIGGSFLSSLAARILKLKQYEAVLLVPLAVSQTKIEAWAMGPYFQRVENAVAGLKEKNLTVDVVLWQQGESNQQTKYADYKRHLTVLVDRLAQLVAEKPIYLAQSTYCKGNESEAVRQAIKDTVEQDRRVFAGANSDVLTGKLYRYDDCHFNRNGMDMLSLLWLEKLF